MSETVPNAFKNQRHEHGGGQRKGKDRDLGQKLTGHDGRDADRLVSSSWSVRFLRSSATLRILMAGSRKSKIIVMV